MSATEPKLSGRRRRALFLIQDGSFTHDTRVRRETETVQSLGLEPWVICPHWRGDRWLERTQGVRVIHYLAPPLPSGGIGHIVEYLLALAQMWILCVVLFIVRGFRVIHMANPPDLLFLVAAPFRLLGVKVVYDQHDLCPELWQARFARGSSGRFRGVMLRLERWSLRSSTAAIACNESIRRLQIERGGIDPERTTVVRNGPDLARFSAVHRPGILPPFDGITLGYLGNINQQDGLDLLVEAVRILRDREGGTPYRAVVIGDGPQLPSVKSNAREHGLDQQFLFQGRMTHGTELCALLTACDLCVQPDPPTAMNELTTMCKAMEYMALGKPLVAFDLAETRETCGDLVVYAELPTAEGLATAIERLARDPPLRERLGREGRRRVEQSLSWEHSARALREHYARWVPPRA